MAKPKSAATTPKYDDAKDVKELLDRIGEDIYKKIKGDSNEFKDELKGNLQHATNSSFETLGTNETCALVNDYRSKANGGNVDPCNTGKDGEVVNRFSDRLGGQCTKAQISGSTYTSGACAPLRRLHVCDRNLETLETKNMDKDTLLGEVCFAAQYEGESIKNDHAQYRADNDDFRTNICTELARSFADIGDIVRGKDLFLGNPQEKEQRDKLDKNLKDIFGNIYEELKKTKGKGKEQTEIETRYGGDANFYKLREDWWTSNRTTIWEAITCKTKDGDKYFRPTCDKGDGKGPEQAHDQCRCPKRKNAEVVPTYFDYVPQFLRWFEEWAEDFCRKRKHKLENAIKKCRGENNEKYCDLNRHDCQQTIRGQHVFVERTDCHECSVSCSPFRKWIDNQKVEFDKQKKKYNSEIKKYENGALRSSKRKRRNAESDTYEGYVKDFYGILKDHYKNVDEFLKKLSDETICKKQPKVGNETEDAAKFNNENTGKTFDHTTYCQACPWCGAQKKNRGNGWEAKGDKECKEKREYGDYKSTEIPILTPDKEKSGILNKYGKFCDEASANDGKGQIKTWKCYYKRKNQHEDNSEDINFCVLQDGNQGDPQEKSMHYNAFFWEWVHDMLIDSVEWRNEHGKCINKDNGKTCIRGCNQKCKCFLKWVQQKEKNEWKQIVEHFKNQENIEQEGDLAAMMKPEIILEMLLNKGELLKIIQDTYGNAKETEHIEKMLNEDEATHNADGTEQKSIIDKLLQHELDDAQKCLGTHQDPCPKPQSPLRSEEHSEQPQPPGEPQDSEDEEEEDHGPEGDEEEVLEDIVEEVESASSDPTGEESPTDQETTEVVEGPQTETATPLDVCPIVKDALTKEKLQDACKQKYNYPNAHLGWKCVTPSGSNTSTSGDAHSGEATPGRGKRSLDAKATTPSANKGGLCVPPRRRKLYLHTPLPGEAVTGEGQEGQAPEVNDTTLRDWFVKSAAIETYFLWHNFKQQKKREKKEKEEAQDALVGTSSAAAEQIQKDLQNELEQNGKIPDDFLRQMFYTLGDYRDILVGISADVTNALKKSFIKPPGEKIKDQEAENDILGYIDKKITAHINSLNSSETPPPRDTSQSNSEKNPRSTLWEQYGPKIWEGMVCALTYKENGNDSPNRDQNVYEKIFGDTTSEKTPPKSSTSGGTYEQTYKYDIVELEASGSTEPITTGNTDRNAASGTKLETFVEYPTFFRWLHEWGNEFCQKRAQQLKKIKEECRGKNYGDKYCGGDGHNCTETGEHDHNDMFAQPNCPRCYEHCLKYRQWIDRKFFEFHEQKGKYQGEYGKLKGNSGACVDVTNKFCGKIKTLTTAAQFLESLKHCKHVEDNDRKSAEEKKNNKIDFNEPQNTFSRSTYCKTCPPTKVTCNGKRGSPDPCKKVNDNGEKWQAVFGGLSGNTTKNINLEMIDRRWPFIKNYSADSNDSFKDSFLFRGFRKQKWECRFDRDNSMGVCKLDQFNDKIDLNEYTTFKVLLLYWLEDFLYGYYTLKKKHLIKKCTENEETCTGESPKKCACVKEWIDTKKNEWNRIKELFHHLEPADRNDTVVSMVKNFLQTLLSRIAPKKHNGEVTQLSDLEKSLGCHCTRESKQQNGLAYDAVGCLLDKLKEKIKTCETQSSGTECTSPTETPPDDEEEEDPPLEDQNPEELNKMMPKFCEKVVKPAETATTDVTCEAAPSPPAGTGDNGGTETANGPEVHAEEEEKQPVAGGSGTPPTPTKVPEAPKEVVPEKKVPVPPPKKPEVPPTKVPEVPRKPAPEKQNRQRGNRQQKTPTNRQTPPRLLQKPDVQLALSSSTLAWCIGIGITGLSYWALMKRKPKPPVKLFSVLDIPKGDFDMPNLTSKNRYIPYGTGKHRGKRYIYIEGDTDDEKYIGDITSSDITSSSESEYEETDTYVRHVPPKYKTLIEVVLEPSKRDTLSGDIPGDIQNDIPTSDINSGDHTPSDDINSGNNIPSDDAPSNKLTDDEWNELKDEFISQYLENTEPNNNISGTIRINTQPNILRDNVDQKPFIMSIHDRNLYTGEEYNYDMINSGIYPSSSNRDSYSDKNGSYSDNRYSLSDKNVSYSGIDLINDSLSGDYIDIYDEILKRKENELFGTENTKHTCIHSVAKHTNTDPILNQINLFHEWLDRHRNMSEKWDNTVDILHKLKEGWENETHSGNKHSDIPIRKLSDTPSGKNVVNSDVSIQIDMDDPKPTNEDNVVDINPHKYTVDSNPNQTFRSSTNPVENNTYVNTPTNVQIEMSVKNREMMKEKYPISDMWDI
ncbi:erythrocyte membrane protein 1, PfEMP1 [Plasmodium sp. DRC-Itaito]|nr:erythrocyte membrane protein 1, PfEMP1 [Plasmodium sp. DRC-Itaito]